MEFILRERPLNDDVLNIASQGKIFKGGYIAILKVYSFKNAWQDNLIVKRFRSIARLQKYLKKNYTQEEIENVEFN